MKRRILFLIASLLILVSLFSFVGCDFTGGQESSSEGFPQIDNSADLNEFIPEVGNDNYLEDETYYTSNCLDLVTEIHGNYSVDRPFTLDKDDQSKRIYHNIYFYEEDFFQVIYYKNIKDLGKIYAILSDATDSEYAEVKYTEKGEPLQIDIIEQGIYNLVLDVQTFAIDMVKVGDIETPVYETIKTCELNIHISASSFSYSKMTLNTETNEYYIEKEIPLNASIGFYSESHNSHYKMTLEGGLQNTYLYQSMTFDPQVRVHVGGKYAIYFNAKTYVLKAELLNADSATYFCQVGWNKGNELTAVSSETPYLFEYEFVAQGTESDPYVEIPDFYPMLGMSYNLIVIDKCESVFIDEYLTEAGTYKLTVNLKDFTLMVEKA